MSYEPALPVRLCLNYLEVRQLGWQCCAAMRSVLIFADSLTYVKEPVIPIYFYWVLRQRDERCYKKKVKLDVVVNLLAVLNSRFPGHRGTFIELSFVIQGKCGPLFCLSCSLALPMHSQLLPSVVELPLRDSALKSSFLIWYSGNRLRDASHFKLYKLKAWKDNQVKKACAFYFLLSFKPQT